jgi:outer membrane protein OmpA-like peptidoglycan-associated protein
MRKKIIILATLLVAGEARANICGTDYQTFNPTTGGLDFVTVQSSETLKPCFVNMGFFVNYAANSLSYSKTLNAKVIKGQKRNDRILGADLSIGTGITDRWDFGVSVPFILQQTVSDNYYVSSFDQTGATEIKMNTKYRILGDENGGVAGILSFNKNLIEDNPFAGKDPGLTWNMELAADTIVAKNWAIAVNAGYRKRNEGDAIPASPFVPMKDQYTYSVAGSYLVASIDTKMIFEMYGSQPVEKTDQDSDRSLRSLEALFGVKHDYSENVALHLGLTKSIDESLGGPDWRVYAGFNWAFGPLCAQNETVVSSNTVPPPANETEPAEVYKVSTEVLFATGKDELGAGMQPVLDQFANDLKMAGFRKLIVEGHSDSVGPEYYNMVLSQRRAEVVRQYLIDKDQIPADKVEAVGKGASEPVADNGNYQGRKKNRRVEFKLWRK